MRRTNRLRRWQPSSLEAFFEDRSWPAWALAISFLVFVLKVSDLFHVPTEPVPAFLLIFCCGSLFFLVMSGIKILWHRRQFPQYYEKRHHRISGIGPNQKTNAWEVQQRLFSDYDLDCYPENGSILIDPDHGY